MEVFPLVALQDKIVQAPTFKFRKISEYGQRQSILGEILEDVPSQFCPEVKKIVDDVLRLKDGPVESLVE